MNEQSLARLETHLERLVEGAFAQFFSKSVRAHDVALQLARAMEGNARQSSDGDHRPIAPDTYIITMHPDMKDRLTQRQPDLPAQLSQHMIELATENSYRLVDVPAIRLSGDTNLNPGELRVTAEHHTHVGNVTAVMGSITQSTQPVKPARPENAQIVINGEQTYACELPVINIGRSRNNHIVFDDPYVSRYHAQLRLRFGHYTLFDTSSQTGTFVNDVRVKEHQLQSGDVIRVGKVQLVYLEDEQFTESQTSVFPPVES